MPRRFKGKPIHHEPIHSLLVEEGEEREELWEMQATLGEEITDDFKEYYKKTARAIFVNSLNI